MMEPSPVNWPLFNQLEALTASETNKNAWTMLRENIKSLERGWEHVHKLLEAPQRNIPSHLTIARYYAEGIRMAARFLTHEPDEASRRDLVEALFSISRWVDLQPSSAKRD
jgi:hypothetical protein